MEKRLFWRIFGHERAPCFPADDSSCFTSIQVLARRKEQFGTVLFAMLNFSRRQIGAWPWKAHLSCAVVKLVPAHISFAFVHVFVGLSCVMHCSQLTLKQIYKGEIFPKLFHFAQCFLKRIPGRHDYF